MSRGDQRRRRRGGRAAIAIAGFLAPATALGRAGLSRRDRGRHPCGTGPPDPGGWQRYLDAFHEDRPGITEDVLADARGRGQSPYQWLAEALPTGAGPVLDLACGSAPLASDLAPRGWVGVDLSLAELARARRRGGAAMARADAAGVPIATSSVPAVVCSMGLMVLQPLPAVAAELARVLVPGGTLVALVPATFPLTMGDALRTARLLAALSRWRLSYPNQDVVRRPSTALAALGLQVVSDERRRFVYQVTTRAAAARLVHSLYLPGVGGAHMADALRVVDRWVGTGVGVPLRRLVARVPA